MASVQYLFGYSDDIDVEIQKLEPYFEELSTIRENCATIIQTHWRTYVAMGKFRHFNDDIVTLQTYFRGWSTRRKYAEFAAQHDSDVCAVRYYKAATKIQAAWRGYQCRKYFPRMLPKDRIAERKKMLEATVAMRETIRKTFEANVMVKKLEDHHDDLKQIVYILFKCHHLLRTRQIEGIYSDHNSKQLSFIESMMKALSLKDYMTRVRQCYKDMRRATNPEDAFMFKTGRLRQAEEFLDQTLLGCQEDAVKTVVDEDKKAFTVLRHECSLPKFSPSVFGTGKYEPPHEFVYRKEDRSKNISTTDLITYLKKELKHDDLPYYIDFWQKQLCTLHYPPRRDL